MLIKALNEYYDILARNNKVCKDGFSRQNITHMIMLRKDGTVSAEKRRYSKRYYKRGAGK